MAHSVNSRVLTLFLEPPNKIGKSSNSRAKIRDSVGVNSMGFPIEPRLEGPY